MTKPLITGTAVDDTINGQSLAEEIQGEGGNDLIFGNGGDDDLYGGEGDDTLSGGAGNDALFGGGGVDTTVFSGNFLDYNFTNNVGGTLTAAHARGTKADGTDIIHSDIEVLSFADRVVDLRSNAAPETQADSLSTHEDARLLNSASVLKNDLDVETYLGRQTLAVTAVNGDAAAIGTSINLPSGAKLLMRANGTYDYDPTGAFNDLALGQTRQDQFTYTVVDSAGASSTATVTITVAGRNDAPIAFNQNLAIQADASGLTTLFAADDVDSNDDPASLTYQLVSGPLEGSLEIQGNGFTFTPGTEFQDLAEGETREVTFTYRAIDQHGAASAIRTVTMNVTGVNDAPVILDAVAVGAVTERNDGPGENAGPDHSISGHIAFTDHDLTDQNSITITPAAEGYLGTLAIDFSIAAEGNGGIINWGFSVPDSDLDHLAADASLTQIYNVTVSDGATSVTQQIVITIGGTNDAPEFNGDGSWAFAITENQPANSFVGQVLATDPDDGSPTYSIVGGTGLGHFAIDADGNIRASHPFDFEGQNNFTLQIEAQDAHGAISLANVTVNVLDRPQIVHNFATDHETHAISSWESNDLIRIDRLSTDLSLQYAEAAGTYLDYTSAKAAASLAQAGVVDVGVAFYYNGTGGTSAVVAVDEDAFGTLPDLYLNIADVSPDQIAASNFMFVA